MVTWMKVENENAGKKVENAVKMKVDAKAGKMLSAVSGGKKKRQPDATTKGLKTNHCMYV